MAKTASRCSTDHHYRKFSRGAYLYRKGLVDQMHIHHAIFFLFVFKTKTMTTPFQKFPLKNSSSSTINSYQANLFYDVRLVAGLMLQTTNAVWEHIIQSPSATGHAKLHHPTNTERSDHKSSNFGLWRTQLSVCHKTFLNSTIRCGN